MDTTQLISRYRSALMGFAQLWIVLLHCWLLIVPNRPILGSIEAFIKWHGIIGVEMFLFLSGIGMTYSIRKNNLLSFYSGRLRRVILPYWVMLVVYAISHHHDASWLLYFATGIGSVTQNFLEILWFIPAIVILYLLFPAYHALITRAKDKTAFTLAALTMWLCSVILLRDVIRSDLWVFINRIPPFLLGVWFGELGRERKLILRHEHWALCILLMVAGYYLRIAGSRGLVPLIPHFPFAASCLCGVSLCFLLAGLFAILENGKLGFLFRHPVRLLSFVGTFTLELYCSHQWLYGKIYTPLEGHISYLGINIISIPAMVAFGWLFYLTHQYLWKCIDKLSHKNKQM